MKYFAIMAQLELVLSAQERQPFAVPLDANFVAF